MTKEDFIKKWNIAFESKEQELEFAYEMNNDLSHLSNESKPLDVEGVYEKFYQFSRIQNKPEDLGGNDIVDFFLSELANIKQQPVTIKDLHQKAIKIIAEHKKITIEEATIEYKKAHELMYGKFVDELKPAVVSPLVNTEELEQFFIKFYFINDHDISGSALKFNNTWDFFLPHLQPKQPEVNKCHCLKCDPNEYPKLRFNVCGICGNKRCPHAEDHNFKCTNSNDVGQPKQPVVNTLPTDEEIKAQAKEWNPEGNEEVYFEFGAKWMRDNYSLPLQQGEDTKSEWVSVEKELPEYYKSVLCFLKESDTMAVCWLASDGDNYIWTITGTDIIINGITHWMKPKSPTI